MKPSLALSPLLLLSTSLLCVAPLTAKQQSAALSEGSEANKREGVIFDNAIVDAQQNSAKKSQGMSSRPGYASKTDKRGCTKADRPYRFDIKHIEAKGLGYNQGYTSIDGFFTGKLEGWIPFLDLRGHVFNNGKWAANAGIGTRYVINPCKSMLGINVYYDYRNTKQGSYNQIGAGVEGYYDHFEVRVNGYLPVEEKRHVVSSKVNSLVFKAFEGHYAHYTKNLNQKVEGAMKGFTSEVGSHIAGDMKKYDLYFGVGPYYFNVGSGDHMWGGKARLKAEVSKYLFLEISDSYDPVFHNRFQGSVTLSIPFGGKKCYCNGPCQSRNKEIDNIMDWRGVLPVERQEIIVVEKFKKKKSIDPIAYNPTTGVPFYFVFVDNTNAAASPDGSYENPAQNLSNGDGLPSAQSLASTDNIIYVFPGDGTATHMNAGMFLNFDRMRLLGSGISNSFNTTEGVLVIPPQSAGFPLIGSQVNTDAVILAANQLEVSGFYISPATGSSIGSTSAYGIRNPSLTLTDVTITNNVIFGGITGISLNDTIGITSGNITITNNFCSLQASPNATQSASILTRNISNADVKIDNNTTTVGPMLAVGLASTFGLDLWFGLNANVEVLNNEVENESGDGIRVRSLTTILTPGSLKANVANNIVRYSGVDGINFTSDQPGSNQMIATNNTVVHSTGNDFSFVTSNNGNTLCVRFNNNTWAGNAAFVNTVAGGIINLEPPVNPQGGALVPGTATINTVPPCFCDVTGCP